MKISAAYDDTFSIIHAKVDDPLVTIDIWDDGEIGIDLKSPKTGILITIEQLRMLADTCERLTNTRLRNTNEAELGIQAGNDVQQQVDELGKQLAENHEKLNTLLS